MMQSLSTDRGVIMIRPVNAADVMQFRGLRLAALQNNPTAFSADYQKAFNQPAKYWGDALAIEEDEGTIFIAEGKNQLIGMAGIRRESSIKTRHGAYIWGVYMDPEWRGLHIAEALIENCVSWAKEHKVLVVKLGVATNNHSAIHCYERCGFKTYGTEPKAIYYEGIYYDEYLMSIELDTL